MLLPVEAQPLLASLLPHFTQPMATGFVILTAAATLSTGRCTVRTDHHIRETYTPKG